MIKQTRPYTNAELLSRHSQGIHNSGKVFTVKSRELSKDGISWIITTEGDRLLLEECKHYNPFGEL